MDINQSYSEQVVVASLLGGEGWDDVTVTAEDFTVPEFKRIFSAIEKQAKAGKPYDLVALFEVYKFDLKDMHNLASNTVGYGEIGKFCKRMKLVAYKRKIAKASAQLIELCKSPASDLDELRAAADSIMADADVIESRTRTIKQVLKNTINQIENRNKVAEGVKTGIGCIDRRMYAMKPGALIVIAARPGVGKTALAVNIAANVASESRSVFFASAEMMGEELAERALCAQSGVNYGAIRSGELKSEDYDLLFSGIAMLKDFPIHIDDTGCPSVSAVCAEAHRLHRTNPLSLVVVDYLTLLKGEGDTRALEVGNISRRLKKLAKDLKCPVIALAQLNRESQKTNRKPVLSDLRDSGEIEQDADDVIFLHHEEAHPKHCVEAIFAKARGYEKGSEWLYWDGAHMRYTEGSAPDISNEKKGYRYEC